MVQRRVNARQLRIPLQMRPKKGWTSQMVSGLWLISCRSSCIKVFSLVESDSLRIYFPRFQGGQDQGLGFVDSLINCLGGSHLEQRWKFNFHDSIQLIGGCTTKSSPGLQWRYPDPLLQPRFKAICLKKAESLKNLSFAISDLWPFMLNKYIKYNSTVWVCYIYIV